ncbi:MAG: T9SS type A sorting domain-containing protein [Ignavibacterium sp.]|nr:T9SS type A sorting domain-containing protein [Ignavibacterium sp.]MDW8374733.1 T9SS type A sorting domain-containing protein [Ignavibacteriales bacterium]
MNKMPLIMFLLCIPLFGQSYKMNVNLKNGSKLEFSIDDIRKITFESSTDFNQLKDILDNFKVFQNYPNPFNPTTTITYQIPMTSLVKVIIYDLNGSLIKELFNGIQNEGEYKIIWDGINNHNLAVSSGIYIYTIESNHQVISKQMILLK